MVNLNTMCIYVILNLLRLRVIDNMKKVLAVARRENTATFDNRVETCVTTLNLRCKKLNVAIILVYNVYGSDTAWVSKSLFAKPKRETRLT